MTIRYLVAKNTVDEMIWTLIDKKLDVLGHALDGKEDKQEVTVLEGRDDAENCIDTFIRGIMDVVDTYKERRDSWKEANEMRKKMRANQDTFYPRDSLFDDGADDDWGGGGGVGVGNNVAGKRKKAATRRTNVSTDSSTDFGNDDDDSGASDVEWNRSDEASNDGFDGFDDMDLPTKKMRTSRRGGGGSGSRRYSPKPIPVFVNNDTGDVGDDEIDRRSDIISPRKLGSFPRAGVRKASASPGMPPTSSRSGSASPLYQNQEQQQQQQQHTSTISPATKASLSARFEQFFNT